MHPSDISGSQKPPCLSPSSPRSPCRQPRGWGRTCWRRRRRQSSSAPGNAPLACAGGRAAGSAPRSCCWTCWTRAAVLEIKKKKKQEASCDLHLPARREGLAAEIPDAQGLQIPAGMDQPSRESHKPTLHPRSASSTDLPRHSAPTTELWASHPPRSSGERTFQLGMLPVYIYLYTLYQQV